MRIKNTNPLGDVEVPALDAFVAAGEIVDVDDREVAAGLLRQAENWRPTDAEAKALADELFPPEPEPTPEPEAVELTVDDLPSEPLGDSTDEASTPDAASADAGEKE